MNATPKLDKFDQLITDSELAACILGNPATLDFEMVNLDPGVALPDGLRDAVTIRGLYFLGTVGIVQGVPRTALAESLNRCAMSLLADAFIDHLEAVANVALECACL